jgi:endonuclease/exonuclease/phosphatase family metal-dependent hydrolase
MARPTLLLAMMTGLMVFPPMQSASPPLIVIDGEFDDWAHVPIAIADDADAPDSPVDVRSVRVIADTQWLWLQFELERPVHLLTAASRLMVLIDTDTDRTTGATIDAFAGADLEIAFSPSGGAARGVEIRRYTGPTPRGETAYPADLVSRPSYLAKQYELRLARGKPRAAIPHERIRLQLVVRRGDALLDETRIAEVVLPPIDVAADVARGPTVDDPLRRADGIAFRAVAWNVGGFAPQRQEVIARVLFALDADVVLLDEITAVRSAEIIQSWLGTRSGDRRPPWDTLLSQGDGIQQAAVALRGRLTDALGTVRHRPHLLDVLLLGTSPSERAADALRFAEEGVTAAGGVGAIGGKRLLAIALDLQCCGTAEEYPDAHRLIESSAVQRAAASARLRFAPQAVVVGGDLNIVGSRDPLDVLRRGLDAGGASLEPVRALDLHGLTDATWRNVGGRGFPPGRLDWMLYSQSTLDVLNAFVFDSALLSSAALQRYSLNTDDSRQSSDHLPVVADFRWKK